MNKQKAIETIHNLGGCDASDDWSKGYDAGITAALDAIEKIPDTDNNADLISRSELQSEIAKCVGECRIKAFDPSVNCILQIIHRLPAAEHRQLAEWLQELKEAKKFIRKLQNELLKGTSFYSTSFYEENKELMDKLTEGVEYLDS